MFFVPREESKSIILVSSKWTKYLNVRNYWSWAFLQDLFARFLSQNGTKGYKRISYFQVNHEDVIILPNGKTLKSAGKYPYL